MDLFEFILAPGFKEMNYFQKRKISRSLYKNHIKAWDQDKIKNLTNIIMNAEELLLMIPDNWLLDLPNTEFKNASDAYTKPYVSGRTYVLC